MRNDEKHLMVWIQGDTQQFGRAYPRDVVKFLGINEKRAAYIFSKWADKGWYDYGVSLMAGWLTDEGMAVQVERY